MSVCVRCVRGTVTGQAARRNPLLLTALGDFLNRPYPLLCAITCLQRDGGKGNSALVEDNGLAIIWVRKCSSNWPIFILYRSILLVLFSHFFVFKRINLKQFLNPSKQNLQYKVTTFIKNSLK